ncbi:rCG41433 [Rattus norvegicus]|uniref:RCG41433 n=1 Tax=Rattus norvegicus TaxID=10116 RepID=A6IH28_RAT|nr:rCG41433 [Rattus norvegicus]
MRSLAHASFELPTLSRMCLNF